MLQYIAGLNIAGLKINQSIYISGIKIGTMPKLRFLNFLSINRVVYFEKYS